MSRSIPLEEKERVAFLLYVVLCVKIEQEMIVTSIKSVVLTHNRMSLSLSFIRHNDTSILITLDMTYVRRMEI